MGLIGSSYAIAVEIIGDEVPVDYVRKHGLGEAAAVVAIVNVVGVLPDVVIGARAAWLSQASAKHKRLGVLHGSDDQAPPAFPNLP